jgi:peptide chain release factor 2
VLNALLKPYEELTAAANDLKAMAELADEDPAFEAELEPALVKAEGQYEGFELQTMMSGKHDAASAVVAIKPGAGGTDACDFAEMLYRAYKRWATRHGFGIEDEDVEPNLEAGVASVSFKIVGPYAYGYMQSEVGVHRLVRISPFGGGDTRRRRSPRWTCCRSWPTTSRSSSRTTTSSGSTSAPAAPAGSTRTRRSPARW